MSDQELRILVPESERGRVERLTRRQLLASGAGGAMGLYLAGCGGSSGGGAGGGGEKAAATPTTPTDAPIEDRLLLANWVDYSDPANYKSFRKALGPKVTVSGYGSNDELLSKLRAGGAKFDVVAPTGYAVKTMIEQDLALQFNRQLIPNLKNIAPAFTKSVYDPGNRFSVPKDFGITGFYWLTDSVSERPATIREAFELLKNPKFRHLRVNILEGATQVVGMALKGSGLSLNSEKPADLDRARQLLLDVKPNIDSINTTYIEKASAGEIDFGFGWNGDVRRAIAANAKEDREMIFMVPEDSTEYWVDNWVIPASAEHPVAAHKWINAMLDPVTAGKEMSYHAYAVPVTGIQGVPADIAEDPIINIPGEAIARYETQLQTPKGQQLRDRVYTEFKAA